MSRKFIIALVILLALLFSSCLLPAFRQPKVVTLPATQVPPSDTPLPPPTETAIPTDTLVPTETPLPTATPGPLLIKDDFSSKADIWEECEHCIWEGGTLVFGPYRPKGTGEDQIFYLICKACGPHPYYRVSADVTFAAGYGDRTFGILGGLTQDKRRLGAGAVTTLQEAMYEEFDYPTGQWIGGSFKKFSAVKPGPATNRILVEITPAAEAGKANIYLSINGTNVVTLFDRDVEPTWAGLYLGWHTVGVRYDNFEYEEIISQD